MTDPTVYERARYQEDCKFESEPRIVTGGYWIWWCKTHKQPHSWCISDRAVKIAEEYKKELDELKDALGNLSGYKQTNENNEKTINIVKLKVEAIRKVLK